MLRIEQLEGRLGRPAPATGAPGDGAEAAPEVGREVRGGGGGRAAAPKAPPVAERTVAGGPIGERGARAAAVAAEPEDSPAPAGVVELEQVQALWPAVAEAIADTNGMLGAALAAARPVALDGERVTVAFPADAAFVKKKAEQGRELVAQALRGMTGASFRVAYELGDDAAPAGPATLGEEELIERLRDEFAAEEIFEHEEN